MSTITGSLREMSKCPASGISLHSQVGLRPAVACSSAMAEKCVTNAGGTWLFCDTDSIAVVASPKGGIVYPKRPEEESEMDQREIAPIPVLPHSTVLKIARRFRSLNPYSFGGDLLKVEDVNYEDGDPKTGSLRTVHGYAISTKRYALMEGSKIIEVKGHGLGYLMSPASSDEPDWMETAWQYVLRLDNVLCDGSDPPWLDHPAMMKIPVSSPAVLGRLKGFCKPFDFVLAPILRSDKLKPEERAEKPILITRFNKHSDEWLDATYYDVRTGKKCRITVGDRKKRPHSGQDLSRNPPSIPLSPGMQVCWTRWTSL